MKIILQTLSVLTLYFMTGTFLWAASYPIVDTGQTHYYDNKGQVQCPELGKAFYGQDAQYHGLPSSYKDNHDGTISDLNTGLMWVKSRGEKITWDDAVQNASGVNIGGYTDWRMPTIKELYSLINFNGGFTPNGNSVPYIDTNYFEFKYGDVQKGERPIDCQDWSATEYVATTMRNHHTVFGVNFADGRIKGYPKAHPRKGDNRLYIRYVRGNPEYGKNLFIDHKDGTITDRATSLMWSKSDSGIGMNWESALEWVSEMNAKQYLGYSDWRLPNAKELQSIVDYTRAPEASQRKNQGAAIDPIFDISKLLNREYPFFWSSTTHLDGPKHLKGAAAVYIAFGRATGWMGKPNRMKPQSQMTSQEEMRSNRSGGGGRKGKLGGGGMKVGKERMGSSNQKGRTNSGMNKTLMDVHGAGAQRSDPKVGLPSQYPYGRGPQGDVIRINNHVRLVRDIG